jgi:hypothetical protein
LYRGCHTLSHKRGTSRVLLSALARADAHIAQSPAAVRMLCTASSRAASSTYVVVHIRGTTITARWPAIRISQRRVIQLEIIARGSSRSIGRETLARVRDALPSWPRLAVWALRTDIVEHTLVFYTNCRGAGSVGPRGYISRAVHEHVAVSTSFTDFE